MSTVKQPESSIAVDIGSQQAIHEDNGDTRNVVKSLVNDKGQHCHKVAEWSEMDLLGQRNQQHGK